MECASSNDTNPILLVDGVPQSASLTQGMMDIGHVLFSSAWAIGNDMYENRSIQVLSIDGG